MNKQKNIFFSNYKKIVGNCKSFITEFSDAFYFRRSCMFCKKIIEKDFFGDFKSSTFFCESCFNRLIKPNVLSSLVSDRCTSCGRPLISREHLCTECLENPEHLENLNGIVSVFSYEGWGRNFLLEWKVREERGLAYFCSEVFAYIIRKKFSDCVCVPVPPRRGKIRKKGWDQITDVCNILEQNFGIPISSCLKRNSCFEQKKLDRLHRFSNMKGIISYTGQSVKTKKTAIIIDDVITTGATLDSCAEVLKENGYNYVYGLTLFYD